MTSPNQIVSSLQGPFYPTDNPKLPLFIDGLILVQELSQHWSQYENNTATMGNKIFAHIDAAPFSQQKWSIHAIQHYLNDDVWYN